MKLSVRTLVVIDCLLAFLFAAALIRPLFKAKYLDKWASIESTFIADGRYLAEHWPHPQWQPLWYGGTRFDYVYPPALRYGTAVLVKAVGYLPVKAYHVYTAFFYCVGIAGVYLLMWAGGKSRGAAWLAAAATALMSPSLAIFKTFRADAWKLLPVRLGVLTKYGEGPHMTALAWIPFALAFTWLVMERQRPWAVALAALSAAAVVSNNFYGATALAVFYPLLVWSHWITRRDRRIFLPAAAIPALAYGLTAFWLVPSYFQVTVRNMQYVAEKGTNWSLWLAAATAITYAIASDRLARRRPERAWAVFLAGSVTFFTLNVVGNYFFNFRISGEPQRLVPEFDMVWIMAVAAVLAWMWRRPGLPLKVAAGVVACAAFATTFGYIRHAWHMFPLWPDYQNRIEYKMSEWMAKNMPGSRAQVNGSVRFWYNAWRDLPQLGGGSEQGLINGMVEWAQWEINIGPEAKPGVLWMQCLGVDAVYVSDKRSQEIYKDTANPKKYEGVLQTVYDDQQGNWIYRVPRRWSARVRVVDTAKLAAQQPPANNTDLDRLRAYSDMLEIGPDSPPTQEWLSSDEMRICARVAAGQSLVVQETWDPAWQAWSGGRQLPLRRDAFGQMAIEAPPGDLDLRLRFATPAENIIGRVVTGFTVLALVALAVVGRRG